MGQLIYRFRVKCWTSYFVCVVFVSSVLIACVAAPAVGTSLALDIGANLLAAVTKNYSGKYASSVQTFLTVLSGPSDKSTSQTEANEPQYTSDEPGGNFPQQGGVENPAFPQQGEVTGQKVYPPKGMSNPSAVNINTTFPNDATYTPGQGMAIPPGSDINSASTRVNNFTAISLDVAILKKISRNGHVSPIRDGAILRDGRGNPRLGDQFKIAFRANCNCYVYVIEVDATGYFEPVFPHPDDPYSNPVIKGLLYEIPKSRGSNWYGLDEYRGIETFYFVVSYRRRLDIEQKLRSLIARNERRATTNYLPVSQPAIIASAKVNSTLPATCTRGIVVISDCTRNRGIVRLPSNEAAEYGITSNGKMDVDTGAGAKFQFTSETFLVNQDGTDLVFTRWFQHE